MQKNKELHEQDQLRKQNKLDVVDSQIKSGKPLNPGDEPDTVYTANVSLEHNSFKR